MKRVDWISILLITILCTVIYVNMFENTFVYDDRVLLLGNNEIKSLKNIPGFFVEPSHANLYRPVRSILYTITYKIWGLNVFGYHLNSLIFHILNSIVIFLILKKLIPKSALIGALLFAAHPIHTGRVTNMTAGFDQFGIFLWFTGFYLYLFYSHEIKYYILSIALFTIGLFSSEELLTLPFVIILYDFIRKKISIKKYIPYFVVSLVYFLIRYLVIGSLGRSPGYFTGSFYTNMISTIPLIWKYIYLLFIPYPLSLEYTPPIYTTFLNPLVIISLLGLLGLAYISLKSKKGLFIAGFFFITLLPFLNFVPLYTLIQERYLYIPSFAFCFLIAYVVSKLKLKKTITLILIGLIILSYSVVVISRNTEWKDSITLFSRTIQTAPKSTRAYDNLGWAYHQEKDYAKAIQYYNKAIVLDSKNYFAHGNLGTLYGETGEYELAITSLQTSVILNGAYYKGLTNLGLAYYKVNQSTKAIKALERAIEIQPLFSKAYNDLGIVYASLGEFKEASKNFEKALEITPEYEDAKHNLKEISSSVQQDYAS